MLDYSSALHSIIVEVNYMMKYLSTSLYGSSVVNPARMKRKLLFSLKFWNTIMFHENDSTYFISVAILYIPMV